MIEEKVAMNLVKKALDIFNKENDKPFPALSISKRYYKRYNFDILNNELSRLNFKCVDQLKAPEPYIPLSITSPSLPPDAIHVCVFCAKTFKRHNVSPLIVYSLNVLSTPINL